MVINMTLGFATLDRLTKSADCGFVCVGLTGAVCANAVHPADRAITTASERLDEKVARCPNMRSSAARAAAARAASPRLLPP
jgi:hypothetical protein